MGKWGKEKERKGKWVAALGFGLGQKMEVGYDGLELVLG